MPDSVIDLTIEIELRSVITLVQSAVWRMVSLGAGGRIVIVGSDSGKVGTTGETVSAACRGGIVAFLKSVVREYARHNILANAVLLPKVADQAGLAGLLSGALKEKRTSPLLDRGIVLVSMAAAIALGATSMSDIALLAYLTPLLGAAPSGPTVDLAGTPRMLERIASARARARRMPGR